MATVASVPYMPRMLRELVVAGRIGPTNRGGTLIVQEQDDVIRQFGHNTYRLMGYDPSCATAMAILISGAIGDGPVLTPAVRAMPGEIVSKRKRKQQIKLADEVCEFNKRGVVRLERPVEETLEDWICDALTFGSSPMEQTYDVVDDETGTGKYMLKSLGVKPRSMWKYRVDASMRVLKLRCRTIDGVQDVEREKFAIFTWQPRYGDPRGNSVYRPAYPDWNYKVQQYPDFASYLQHFADPSLIVKAGPDAEDKKDPITGKTTTVSQQMVAIGELYRKSATIGLSHGADAILMESKGTGEAYHKAFDRYDLQIIRSILIGTRPITDAQHNSVANDESGLDLVAIAVNRVRRPASRAFRDDILYRQTIMNYGKEVADLLTPECNFGIAKRDIVALLKAYGQALKDGVLKEGHLPKIWDETGVGAPVENEQPVDKNTDNQDPNAKDGKQDPNAKDDKQNSNDNKDQTS
jgi:hypothetical protein